MAAQKHKRRPRNGGREEAAERTGWLAHAQTLDATSRRDHGQRRNAGSGGPAPRQHGLDNLGTCGGNQLEGCTKKGQDTEAGNVFVFIFQNRRARARHYGDYKVSTEKVNAHLRLSLKKIGPRSPKPRGERLA
jgi:hypothetical protein